ncbi:uncharacterized protein V6R79_007324 [Siganus canaliculatus]
MTSFPQLPCADRALVSPSAHGGCCCGSDSSCRTQTRPEKPALLGWILKALFNPAEDPFNRSSVDLPQGRTHLSQTPRIIACLNHEDVRVYKLRKKERGTPRLTKKGILEELGKSHYLNVQMEKDGHVSICCRSIELCVIFLFFFAALQRRSEVHKGEYLLGIAHCKEAFFLLPRRFASEKRCSIVPGSAGDPSLPPQSYCW